MLTITPEALRVIRRVTANPTLDPASGLRIAPRQDPSAPMEVRAVPTPRPGDRVLERDGARLFLGPRAAARVERCELDAEIDERGRVQFVLRSAA